MIRYSKLFNRSRQISRLSKDSFINFAVLICTFLFLDDNIDKFIDIRPSKIQVLGSKITKFTANAKKMVF